MKMIIGGYAQGKLNYAREHFPVEENNIYDGCLPEGSGITEETVVVNHLNQWFLSLENRQEAMGFLEGAAASCKELILITEEVGNGIVPLKKEERQWRDQVGALQIQLAARSDEVIRVICGIGQKIK